MKITFISSRLPLAALLVAAVLAGACTARHRPTPSVPFTRAPSLPATIAPTGPTASPTSSPTLSPARSASPAPSASPTPTPTLTPTASSSASPSPSPTPRRTHRPRPTPTPVQTVFPRGSVIVTFGVLDEEYRVLVTDALNVAIARELLAGQEAPRIPNGVVVRDGPGVNIGWSWHIDPESFEFADVTVEVCDGKPSYVEDKIITGDRFCPWSAEVIAVEPTAP